MSLGVAVDWNRVTPGTTSADLWVGMRLPAGEFLYAHPDGQWRAEAKALVTGMRATGEIRIFDALLLPAGLGERYATLRCEYVTLRTNPQ